MMGYVYAQETYRRCAHCTEAERQQALATAQEDFTRLSPALQQGLGQGTLGVPNMESIE
jgi:hypothetical protein